MSYQELSIKLDGIKNQNELIEIISNLVFSSFNCRGINEYTMNEDSVDGILGDRSYCGGDVTLDLIEEVDSIDNNEKIVLYFDEEENIDDFKKFLSNLNLEFIVETKKNEDWNSEWKKHFEKIEIDDEMDVVPSWESKDKKDDVMIYPGQGFGTGSHETTFLCLKLLREFNKKEKLKIFDHGCGSGILGIASKKHFCDAEVHMYDIDPQAYDNTIQNLELNQYNQNDIRVIKAEDKNKINEKYDLIFANILLHVLKEEKEFLLNRLNPNGKIIFSGILNEQLDELKKIYSNLNLVKFDIKNDWTAAIFENK